MCWGRVTSGWVRAVPSCMEAGDVVAVLAGAGVPFVIRRKDDGSGAFLLVGEAHVDGLVVGELPLSIPWRLRTTTWTTESTCSGSTFLNGVLK
ncbi:hypothetical protein B0I37DRAFT_375502 [Chaetomium sp. MPI-CAGE-AT-0009]|nr:hypothetical protein B0I37DRAFT_375502 [Chaetomium sp. MPI-CAGE-AT-0009]